MKKSDSEMVISDNALSTQITQFEYFLEKLNLPSENIIANLEERENIMNMLPNLISKIPIEQKTNAIYISKFIAGAAIGLFDASLNYVWNEVIVNLRNKIVNFGLDTFFDNAVGNKIRDQYKSENDLIGIKDRTLLDTCRKLEWISDVVYTKLCHILDMRNKIGASHPNNNVINSYELLGWLKTCITDVINDFPSKSASMIKGIVENIKKQTTPIDDTTINSITKKVSEFTSDMCSNLLLSLFGIYISDGTSNEIRNNILLLSEKIWIFCKSETKYDLGEKKEYYRNSLNSAKESLTYIFLERCNGLKFLTLTEKSLQLSNLCDNLIAANSGWDNYYNEPPIVKEIMKYINNSSDIPNERTEKIINTFLICRIGREVNYYNGVSPGAKDMYDQFFKLLSKDQIKILLSLFKMQMNSIFNGESVRARNAGEIISMLKSPVIGERLNEIIDYMITFSNQKKLNKVYIDTGFKELCNGVIFLEN
jgi:hypothetical protein